MLQPLVPLSSESWLCGTKMKVTINLSTLRSDLFQDPVLSVFFICTIILGLFYSVCLGVVFVLVCFS